MELNLKKLDLNTNFDTFLNQHLATLKNEISMNFGAQSQA